MWVSLTQHPRVGIRHRQRAMIGRFAHHCRIDAIGRGISAGHRVDHFGLIAAPEELAMDYPPTDLGQRGFAGIEVFAVFLFEVSEELRMYAIALGTSLSCGAKAICA
jgi:hypothetical protein